MSDLATTFEIPDGTMAMTNDDGIVVTLLQRDPDAGASIRHNGEWTPLVDPSTLDGLNFVGVTDEAIEFYDRIETEGNLAPIKYFPASPDGPFWTESEIIVDDRVLDEETGEYSGPEDEVEEEPEPLAASVRLDTADDLTAAIAAAVEDPEIRWYVERRVAALGLEAVLPWHEG